MKILFDWASGKGHGVVTFVILYMVYIIGYTLNNVTAQIIPAVMTNDPRQRPLVGVWSTVYNYLIPMIFSGIITMVILPRYGNEYTVPMLAESSWLCIGISAVFLILCCIGVTPVDKPESFTRKSAAPRWNDKKCGVWRLLCPIFCNGKQSVEVV